MFFTDWFDRWWESYRVGKPNLVAFDKVVDQTHLHHTLICVLIFGPVGVLFYWLTRHYPLHIGLAHGILIGWLFYMLREVWNRKGNWTYRLWDGFMDVFVPVVLTGPWVFGVLFGVVPAWTGLLLYLGCLVMVLLYTVFRPLSES